MVVQRSRHVPLTQVFLGSAPYQACSHFALDLAVHPFLGVTWSQTAFQCPWPRRGLTAAHKLEHRAYGDLTPFPWACLGDKYEVYCLSRFLRLPRGGYCYLVWILLYSWSWPFCWHPHIQPRCSVSARAWGTVKPDTIFFRDCNCRSLLAESCLQSDQRLSKLPFPFSFLSRTHTHPPHPKVSMWTWTACGDLSRYSFPQCDLRGLQRVEATKQPSYSVSTFMKTETEKKNIMKQ